MTDVVAALIWDKDRFLACQRPAHKKRGLLWEFVGGKVEPGETPEQALIRECKEELDVTVCVEDVFTEVIHDYPDMTVRLILYNAYIIDDEPKLLEHNALRWIRTSDIQTLSFCPADKDILELLKKLDNGLQAKLFALRDEKYRLFQASLMPTIDPAAILGVRIPQLREFARKIPSVQHLGALPHKYYEENCLHGILINHIKDYTVAIDELNRFLPYVDNWAVCDLLSPKAFTKRPEPLIPQVYSWLQSDHSYSVRFGIGVLMKFYLTDAFNPEHMSRISAINSDDYYVNMMIAWYFATALAKQYDHAVGVLQNHKLSRFCHNKTIQNACESYRIAADTKAYLRSLKY